MLLNLLCITMGRAAAVPNTVLFVQFFVATFLTSGYRVFVKILYHAGSEEASAVNIIIFGAETNGLQLQKTIRHISGSQFKVVAFVEDEESLVGKTIDNLRIYSCKQLTTLIQSCNIKYLFFARQEIDIAVKNQVVNECLANNVQVKNIPSVKKWMQGNLHFNELKEVKIEELLGRPAIELSNTSVVNFLLNKKLI